MMELLTSGEAWLSLLTLTLMEIVLGVDNIVFISILVGKLPPAQRKAAWTTGLSLALLTRLALLLAITWVMRLTAPLFTVLGKTFSGKDLILLGGGAFLVAKATWEIYDKLEAEHPHEAGARSAGGTYAFLIVQILLLDLVFSLDSVITAVGMARHIPVMVTAMVLAVGFMLVFARKVGDFVDRHPSIKMLALAFLILIGVVLVADGLGEHISKGYIYSAMAFSLAVEMLNMRFRKKHAPVELRERYRERA
ncbi:MAG TPA: TerC family protein [Candidatus Polarisedimenticolaceae bacterium]|nr:TerC family protein [Candidatus Polarisedimenticolaceae bacterium]